MKLFLSGGGSGQDSFELDKKFIEAVDLSKPVLYIPIAINSIKHPYPECLEWLQGNFAPLGFSNFVMWTEEDLQGKAVEDFTQFGGIYIGGGNTFKLLKELKEFGILAIFKDVAEKNIPIYGGSAGALIFAESIITAIPYDPNDVALVDLNGLNLIHNYNIWVHYKGSMDSLIQSYMSQYGLQKIIAIPESAGLVITNEHIEIVGPSKVTVFADAAKGEVAPSTLI
ncbi:MAG: Type 1 glutamine amidotransferase-like domain-containing protein [Minisyncoccia bacterium]